MVTRRIAPWLLALGLLGSTGLIASCSESADTSGDLSAFCSLLVSASDPFAGLEDSLEPVVEDLRQLHAVAPAEIQPAVETLLVTFEAVAAEPDPDTATELLGAQQAEWLGASEELTAYALANCGIDLNR